MTETEQPSRRSRHSKDGSYTSEIADTQHPSSGSWAQCVTLGMGWDGLEYARLRTGPPVLQERKWSSAPRKEVVKVPCSHTMFRYPAGSTLPLTISCTLILHHRAHPGILGLSWTSFTELVLPTEAVIYHSCARPRMLLVGLLPSFSAWPPGTTSYILRASRHIFFWFYIS